MPQKNRKNVILMIVGNALFCLIISIVMQHVLEKNINRTEVYNQWSERPIQIERRMRLLDRFGYEGEERKLRGQSACISDGYYYSCGGYDSNKKQSITQCDLHGRIIRSRTYTELYHANSIAIVNDYIIIANGNGPFVTILDKRTLDIVKTISFEDGILNVIGVDSYENKVYVRARTNDNNNVVARINSINTGDYEVLCILPGVDNTVKQGFSVYDGYAYFLYNHGNMIYKADISRGEYVAAFCIPESDGWNPVGEPEDLYVDNGIMYIICAVYPENYIHSKAAMVSIFATDVLGILQKTSAEDQSIKDMRLIVDGFAETTANPKNSFNTIEEACAVLNTRHSGTIVAQNIGCGYCYLQDGIYSIVGRTGNRFLDSIEVVNSTAVISQFSNISKTTVDTSSVTMRAVRISGSLVSRRSSINFIRAAIADETSIDQSRSSFFFDELVGFGTDIGLKATEPISNVTNVRTTYINNLLQLLQGCNSDIAISVYTSDSVLNGLIPNSYLQEDVFSILTNDKKYPEICYSNGVIYIVDSNSKQHIVDNSCIIELYSCVTK